MRLLSKRKVAAMLDCSQATLDKLIENDGFPEAKGRLTSAQNSPSKWCVEEVEDWITRKFGNPLGRPLEN